jgi:hypothetical protein
MKPRRQHVSLKREYSSVNAPNQHGDEASTSRPRRRTLDPAIRSLQPLIFFADASDLDVTCVHLFDEPDADWIALDRAG